jgi:hypothetical protein
VRAVAADDAKNGPGRAVAWIARAAELANAAAGIDLADNSFAYQSRVGGVFDNPDELMANCPIESGITSRDFEICIADSGKRDAHERFVPADRFRGL